jgi:dihydroorotate dehydrogenase (fumarate)/dihydroorotate dehydrogenase
MLDHLGFGFVEIGSISARPSKGNPKPRLFRLLKDRAIVVNYGLPNDGAEVIAKRLAAYRPRLPLGVNIVKTNDGPDAAECSIDEILSDYARSVSLTQCYASYLVLNLSCPNAKGGRDIFATKGHIIHLLDRLRPLAISCPVFLKIAPTPDPESLERLVVEAEPYDFVRGFIFNLPTGKPDTLNFTTPRSDWENMPGAVAGKPVETLINRCIRELYSRMPRKRFEIIGAGGVFSANDAYEKIRSGASLVQIYSALVYEGPGIVKQINRGLLKLLERDGFKSIREAVGTECQV